MFNTLRQAKDERHQKSPIGKVSWRPSKPLSQRGREASRSIDLGRTQPQLIKELSTDGCLHEWDGLCSDLPKHTLVSDLTLSDKTVELQMRQAQVVWPFVVERPLAIAGNTSHGETHLKEWKKRTAGRRQDTTCMRRTSREAQSGQAWQAPSSFLKLGAPRGKTAIPPGHPVGPTSFDTF